MKQRAAPSLILILSMLAGAYSQNSGERNGSAKLESLDIRITADVPNVSALDLARPSYPSEFRVTGKAVVRVKIDRGGNVVSARAISGHALLKSSVVDAARRSKFKRNSARGAKYVAGSLTYVFAFAVRPYDDLHMAIGQQVTLRGEFSLRGKLAPYILYSGKPVYLIASGSFSWGTNYSEMEGKLVSVSGTLRFHKGPPQAEIASPLATARVPDHYYFEAESAKVLLVTESEK